MASQPANNDGLNFTGGSAEEAEDFIQAMNKLAYAAGKHKDNAWIAEFAYPFFSRKAIHWYENLDEGTQNDRKLLKRRSSSSRSTPAAPPPPTMTQMIGRIRVDSEAPEVRGYLVYEKAFADVRENINEASVFEADISGQAVTFKASSGTKFPLHETKVPNP
ncbi:hypothetical protein FRC00_001498 [Tulasnella sp. 408]|nr:hypothetical protein FRC00_001498 [Tulasnella sp. 408]